MEPGISHFLVLSSLLFVIGLVGVMVRRNVLIVLLSIEIMLNGAILASVSFAYFQAMMGAQVFALFLMALAAAEAGLALAILVLVYRKQGVVSADDIQLLKQ